jgi:hypothetical protein
MIPRTGVRSGFWWADWRDCVTGDLFTHSCVDGRIGSGVPAEGKVECLNQQCQLNGKLSS